jgi:hypothetical protein
MSATIRIYWHHRGDINYPWNETCARAVEMFGLPGDKFTTRVTTDWMDFIFASNKDALLFAIEHNGEFISEDQLVVESIPSKIFKFS